MTHIGAQPDKAIAILQSLGWVRTSGLQEFGTADGRAVIDLISGKLLEKVVNKLITGRRRLEVLNSGGKRFHDI